MYPAPLKRRQKTHIAPILTVALLLAPLANASDTEGDAEHGRQLFNQCKACHGLTNSDRRRVGPTLYGVFDRTVGTLDGYKYSAALKKADFQWTADHLDDWLANPNSYLPGNKMPYGGMRNPSDRKDLIAYLLKATVSMQDNEN